MHAHPVHGSLIRGWLTEALAASGMTQAQLGRHLAVGLNRPFTRSSVSQLFTGARTLKADEMLEVSRICRLPVPRLEARQRRSGNVERHAGPDMFDADRGNAA